MTASRSQRPRGAGHCSKHPKHIISLTQLAPWRLVKFGTVLPTGHEVQWLSRPPQVAVPGRRVGTQASPPPGDRALQQPGLWAPVPSGLRSTGKSRMLWGPQDSVCSEETCGPPHAHRTAERVRVHGHEGLFSMQQHFGSFFRLRNAATRASGPLLISLPASPAGLLAGLWGPWA